jgi:hypothetical protein
MHFPRSLVLACLGCGLLPAQPAAKPPLPVVMFAGWRDPNEGAFTLNVPKGWEITGGASRRSAVDIRHIVRATAPGGRIHIFIDDPNIVPRQVPDQMMQRMGMREGQTIQGAWGGPLLLQRFRSGAQYSRDYTGLKVCPNAQYTGGADLARETNDMNREVMAFAAQAGMNARASVGDAYFHCGAQLGYVTATTVFAGPRMGQGAQMWFVMAMSGFTVESEADAAYALYILHTMTASFQLDPQWEARSQRDTQALTQSVTHMQNAMMSDLKQSWAAQADRERSSVVSRNKPFDVMSGWEARNKTMDKVFEKDTEVRRGVTVTEDPVWGSRTVSNDYNYYWTRPDGSIVGTTTDTAPRLDGGGWRMMTNH